MRPLAPKFRTKVVGVSFVAGYPDNLFQLERRTVRRDLYDEGPVFATLRRDADNPHDPNAVVVEVGDLGAIGHIAAPLAARLAPELDDGVAFECEVVAVLVGPDAFDHPGVDLEIRKPGGRA